MEGAPFIAETPRLQLRRVKLSDAEFFDEEMGRSGMD